MRTIAELNMTPVGVGTSISSYVAEAERVLQKSGLHTQLHACGTNIEGELSDVLRAVKECHEILHEKGAPRVTTTLTIETSIDREDTFEGRVQSVDTKLHGVQLR